MVANGLGGNMNQKAKYIIGRPTIVMRKCLSERMYRNNEYFHSGRLEFIEEIHKL
jgi:hypothetical protein